MEARDEEAMEIWYWDVNMRVDFAFMRLKCQWSLPRFSPVHEPETTVSVTCTRFSC